jgi:hypothetical protein
MAILDFFQELLRIFIIYFQNFSILSMRLFDESLNPQNNMTFQFSFLFLAKVMTIPGFFLEILRILIQKNSELFSFEFAII